MTIQCREIIIYNGKETSMYSWPDLPESHSRIKLLSDEEIKAADVNSVISTSRCWREYVGTWEVKDGRLYLVHLNGRYSLNGDDPLFADWFSGIVEIPDGEARSGLLHGVRGIFEKEIHVEIENGVVTKTCAIDNRGKGGTHFLEDDEKHFSRKDNTPSLTDIRKAAEQGDLYAQISLGCAYQAGSGVPQDDTEAFKWFGKAAEQGNTDAQFYLGLSLSIGEGVEEDKAEAAKWFHKVAVLGDSIAQRILGDCYFNGEGVEEDKAEAAKWYRKSVESSKLIDESEWEYKWFNNGDISIKNCSDERWEGPILLEVTIKEINFYKVLKGPRLIVPGEEYIYEDVLRIDDSDIYMVAQLYRPYGRYSYERKTLH